MATRKGKYSSGIGKDEIKRQERNKGTVYVKLEKEIEEGKGDKVR